MDRRQAGTMAVSIFLAQFAQPGASGCYTIQDLHKVEMVMPSFGTEGKSFTGTTAGWDGNVILGCLDLRNELDLRSNPRILYFLHHILFINMVNL